MALPRPDEALRALHRAERDEHETERPVGPLKRIHLDVVGEHGKRYVGDFVYKVPNLGEKIQIGRLKGMYLSAEGTPDIIAGMLVEQICYLTVTLQKDTIPAWWDPFNFYDPTPIMKLYEEACAHERKFHGADAGEGISAEDRGEPDDDRREDGADPAHVGRKVRPASERRETLVSHSEGGG